MRIDIINKPWKFEAVLNNGFWEIFAAVSSKIGCRPSWNGNHGNRDCRKKIFLIFLGYNWSILTFKQKNVEFYWNLKKNILKGLCPP